MKTPLLVIGYERSGTTLLRRLISMHPHLPAGLIHEQGKQLLSAATPAAANRKFAKDKRGSKRSISIGQKLPYAQLSMAQKYVKKFRGFFPQSWIIHLIRDPKYAINSQVRTFERDPKSCIRNYFDSVPNTHHWLQGLDRVKTIHYETLIGDPENQVRELYDWLSSGVSDEHIARVISTKKAWKADGKLMEGLRYFDKIVDTKPNMVLSNEHIERIEAMKKLHKDLFA
jgi:hypothetical protein